jgi:hypothetical protein
MTPISCVVDSVLIDAYFLGKILKKGETRWIQTAEVPYEQIYPQQLGKSFHEYILDHSKYSIRRVLSFRGSPSLGSFTEACRSTSLVSLPLYFRQNFSSTNMAFSQHQKSEIVGQDFPPDVILPDARPAV